MKPVLVTMGDPAGIGPEIVARLFQRGAAGDAVVLGDPGVMRRALALLPGPAASVVVIRSPAERAGLGAGCVPVVCPTGLPEGLEHLPWGRVDARAGAAAARCVEQAVALVRAGQGSAVVTAPLHKEALGAAGIEHPGHTEMLQHLAAGGGELPPVRMMLANDELRVVLVTLHVALRRAIEMVTFDAVLQTLHIAHRSARSWGVDRPRVAVAGLNPHAGEGGRFGDEELRIIAPAVEAARAAGIDARGPFPPDTVFMRARRAPGHPGEFDVVLAMTHDHGLIPVKYLGMDKGVNVTLGLPFVRTSPDHGTAFDIAGRGVADDASLESALIMARELARAG